MRLETLKTSGSAGLGAAASKVVGWHRLGPGAVCVAPGLFFCPKFAGESQASKLFKRDSGAGPAASPYPAPSYEGALPLCKILAAARRHRLHPKSLAVTRGPVRSRAKGPGPLNFTGTPSSFMQDPRENSAKKKKGIDFWVSVGYNNFRCHGGVAQLGERLNGIQEVMGSIPTVSTRPGPGAACVAPGSLLCPKSAGESQASKLFKRARQKPGAAYVVPGLLFCPKPAGGF